jgi:hypothetical protein
VNDGTVWQVDLGIGARTLIASGGSRGDLVAVDPSDGTLLLAQTDRILRLHGPTPCGRFGTSSLTLAPSAPTTAVGATETVTATATVNGRPAAGIAVSATVAGANATTASCTTGASGTCTFGDTGANAAVDTITATAAPVCGETVTTSATDAWCGSSEPTTAGRRSPASGKASGPR